jgi:hypothetical protein
MDLDVDGVRTGRFNFLDNATVPSVAKNGNRNRFSSLRTGEMAHLGLLVTVTGINLPLSLTLA